MTKEVYQDLEPSYEAVGNAFMFNWVFHYNPLTELWNAIPRDYYNQYWNDANHPRYLKSKNISDLKELLYKTKGDLEEIENFING